MQVKNNMRHKNSNTEPWRSKQFYIIFGFERIFDAEDENVDKTIKLCEIPIIVHSETNIFTIWAHNHRNCYFYSLINKEMLIW